MNYIIKFSGLIQKIYKGTLKMERP